MKVDAPSRVNSFRSDSPSIPPPENQFQPSAKTTGSVRIFAEQKPMSYKLFIPGPIAVSEKTLRAMAQPMIGHRSTDFVALYQAIQPELQALVYTQDPVYLSTSSAFGSMEGALRSLVQKKVLSCMNGAFADKWHDVALRNGKAATALKFEWGQPVDPEAVRRELATGAYDAITLIHNATTCGCTSDLGSVMKVVQE